MSELAPAPTPPSGLPALAWVWRPFADLTVTELYAALQLRSSVFVVEQQCPYLDPDGWDDRAWHLLGYAPAPGDGRPPVLAAYVRIFPAGVKYAEASIGRVVSNPLLRRSGAGRAVMAEAIRRCALVAPGQAIRIGAQMYLERFYESFGFRTVSAPYDEDGILHVEMVRDA